MRFSNENRLLAFKGDLPASSQQEKEDSEIQEKSQKLQAPNLQLKGKDTTKVTWFPMKGKTWRGEGYELCTWKNGKLSQDYLVSASGKIAKWDPEKKNYFDVVSGTDVPDTIRSVALEKERESGIEHELGEYGSFVMVKRGWEYLLREKDGERKEVATLLQRDADDKSKGILILLRPLNGSIASSTIGVVASAQELRASLQDGSFLSKVLKENRKKYDELKTIPALFQSHFGKGARLTPIPGVDTGQHSGRGRPLDAAGWVLEDGSTEETWEQLKKLGTIRIDARSSKPITYITEAWTGNSFREKSFHLYTTDQLVDLIRSLSGWKIAPEKERYVMNGELDKISEEMAVAFGVEKKVVARLFNEAFESNSLAENRVEYVMSGADYRDIRRMADAFGYDFAHMNTVSDLLHCIDCAYLCGTPNVAEIVAAIRTRNIIPNLGFSFEERRPGASLDSKKDLSMLMIVGKELREQLSYESFPRFPDEVIRAKWQEVRKRQELSFTESEEVRNGVPVPMDMIILGEVDNIVSHFEKKVPALLTTLNANPTQQGKGEFLGNFWAKDKEEFKRRLDQLDDKIQKHKSAYERGERHLIVYYISHGSSYDSALCDPQTLIDALDPRYTTLIYSSCFGGSQLSRLPKSATDMVNTFTDTNRQPSPMLRKEDLDTMIPKAYEMEERTSARNGNLVQKKFRRADINGDGFVTLGELRYWLDQSIRFQDAIGFNRKGEQIVQAESPLDRYMATVGSPKEESKGLLPSGFDGIIHSPHGNFNFDPSAGEELPEAPVRNVPLGEPFTVELPEGKTRFMISYGGMRSCFFNPEETFEGSLIHVVKKEGRMYTLRVDAPLGVHGAEYVFVRPREHIGPFTLQQQRDHFLLTIQGKEVARIIPSKSYNSTRGMRLIAIPATSTETKEITLQEFETFSEVESFLERSTALGSYLLEKRKECERHARVLLEALEPLVAQGVSVKLVKVIAHGDSLITPGGIDSINIPYSAWELTYDDPSKKEGPSWEREKGTFSMGKVCVDVFSEKPFHIRTYDERHKVETSIAFATAAECVTGIVDIAGDNFTPETKRFYERGYLNYFSEDMQKYFGTPMMDVVELFNKIFEFREVAENRAEVFYDQIIKAYRGNEGREQEWRKTVQIAREFGFNFSRLTSEKQLDQVASCMYLSQAKYAVEIIAAMNGGSLGNLGFSFEKQRAGIDINNDLSTIMILSRTMEREGGKFDLRKLRKNFDGLKERRERAFGTSEELRDGKPVPIDVIFIGEVDSTIAIFQDKVPYLVDQFNAHPSQKTSDGKPKGKFVDNLWAKNKEELQLRFAEYRSVQSRGEYQRGDRHLVLYFLGHGREDGSGSSLCTPAEVMAMMDPKHSTLFYSSCFGGKQLLQVANTNPSAFAVNVFSSVSTTISPVRFDQYETEVMKNAYLKTQKTFLRNGRESAGEYMAGDINGDGLVTFAELRYFIDTTMLFQDPVSFMPGGQQFVQQKRADSGEFFS